MPGRVGPNPSHRIERTVRSACDDQLLCPYFVQYVTLLPKLLYSLCTIVLVKIGYRNISTEFNQLAVDKAQGIFLANPDAAKASE